MKVTVDIDCTPAEARAFMGLPDIATMQEDMLKNAQGKMSEAMKSMGAEDIMKLWFPASAKSFGDLQRMMWDQMGKMTGTKPAEKPAEKPTATKGRK